MTASRTTTPWTRACLATSGYAGGWSRTLRGALMWPPTRTGLSGGGGSSFGTPPRTPPTTPPGTPPATPPGTPPSTPPGSPPATPAAGVESRALAAEATPSSRGISFGTSIGAVNRGGSWLTGFRLLIFGPAPAALGAAAGGGGGGGG